MRITSCGFSLEKKEAPISQTSTYIQRAEKEFFPNINILRYFRLASLKSHAQRDMPVGSWIHSPHGFFFLGHGLLVVWLAGIYLS